MSHLIKWKWNSVRREKGWTCSLPWVPSVPCSLPTVWLLLAVACIITFREVKLLIKGTQLMSHRAKIQRQGSDSRPWALNHFVLLPFMQYWNRGNSYILGKNTDVYNFSGDQYDHKVPFLGMYWITAQVHTDIQEYSPQQYVNSKKQKITGVAWMWVSLQINTLKP